MHNAGQCRFRDLHEEMTSIILTKIEPVMLKNMAAPINR